MNFTETFVYGLVFGQISLDLMNLSLEGQVLDVKCKTCQGFHRTLDLKSTTLSGKIGGRTRFSAFAIRGV